MLRKLVVAVLVVAGCALAPSGALAFQSDNVQLLGKLPEAVGAIGARFSPDRSTMYVTAATGLYMYDIRVPEAPRRLGRLPLPHFENEDVDVGRVGGRDVVIISNDPSFNQGLYGAIYVIDVTDAANPTLLSITPTRLARQIRDQIGFESAASNNGHAPTRTSRTRAAAADRSPTARARSTSCTTTRCARA